MGGCCSCKRAPPVAPAPAPFRDPEPTRRSHQRKPRTKPKAFPPEFSFLEELVENGEMTKDEAVKFMQPQSPTRLRRKSISDIDENLKRATSDLRQSFERCLKTRSDGLVYLDFPLANNPPSFMLPCHSESKTAEAILKHVGTRQEIASEVKALKEPLTTIEKLADLYTEASGDCLLNALCLSLFGLQDLPPEAGNGKSKLGVLRSALHASLKKCKPLQDRIKEVFSEADLKREIQRASVSGGSGSLSASSIFALSNVLRRPIVCLNTSARERQMISEEKQIGLEFSERLSGIYLPSLWNPTDCWRDAVLIAYADGHFFAMVPFMNEAEAKGGHANIPASQFLDGQLCRLPLSPFTAPESKLDDYADQEILPCAGADGQGVLVLKQKVSTSLDPATEESESPSGRLSFASSTYRIELSKAMEKIARKNDTR